MQAMSRGLVLFVCLSAALAQQGPMPVNFEERPALQLANDKIELTVLRHGGALASILLRDDTEKINPFWNPIRYAREQGRTLKDYAIGHFVCVDGFGPVSREEREAGLPGHGEAHTLPWDVRYAAKENRAIILTQTVRLPIHQETFTRTIRVVDGENTVYVESELESQLSFDRPANWAEHATIGAPFLEPVVTVVDMPAGRAMTRVHEKDADSARNTLSSFQEFKWPDAPLIKGGKINLRAFPANSNSLDHTTCRLDPSRKFVFVTALHKGKRLMLGYLFEREHYPWLQNWQHYPSDGRTARGLEFSTQPFDVPRREAVQMNTLLDTPTYRWLPAKAKITSRYLLFYARAPEGFLKVDDVRVEKGQLIVEDRKARKQITLAASLW